MSFFTEEGLKDISQVGEAAGMSGETFQVEVWFDLLSTLCILKKITDCCYVAFQKAAC